jgi:hypothetical protein
MEHRIATVQIDGTRVIETADAVQAAQVVIEGTVLLHQEDDVLHIRNRTRLVIGGDCERPGNAIRESGGESAGAQHLQERTAVN